MQQMTSSCDFLGKCVNRVHWRCTAYSMSGRELELKVRKNANDRGIIELAHNGRSARIGADRRLVAGRSFGVTVRHPTCC